MAFFLPTDKALQQLALLSGRERNDPAVVALFDQLVLLGHLVPVVPDWWELMGWRLGELERVLQRGALGPSWGPVWGPR